MRRYFLVPALLVLLMVSPRAEASCLQAIRGFLGKPIATLKALSQLKVVHGAVIAAALAGQVDTTAMAAIVDSSRIPAIHAPADLGARTWGMGGWPYEFNPLLPDPPSRGLFQKVDRAHEQWGDHIFFSEKAGVDFLATSPWRADQMINFNAGPEWIQTTGGWQTYLVPADDETLLAVGFGTITRYDMTPNTPGLYQFTTLSYTGEPGVLRITHYSWVLSDPRYGQEFLSHGYQPIPGPGPLALMGAAAFTILRRRR